MLGLPLEVEVLAFDVSALLLAVRKALRGSVCETPQCLVLAKPSVCYCVQLYPMPFFEVSGRDPQWLEALCLSWWSVYTRSVVE